MVRFGPSGNSDSFYAEGHKSSMEMPVWIKNMGLNAFEYLCTRGVRLRPETAKALGAEAEENGIKMSVHAPYYINLATFDEINIQKSAAYIIDTAIAATQLGADRVVFHPGAVGKGNRKDAYEQVKRNLYEVLEQSALQALTVRLSPETAGKRNQIGDLDEILDLCLLDSSLIPTFDFGHLHAYNQGSLNTIDDFRYIFDTIFEVLGEKRAKDIHIHYARIEYTEKSGEKKHWSYDDIAYGPDFEPLAACLLEYDVSATIISESRGTMAEDSQKIKNIYDRMAKL